MNARTPQGQSFLLRFQFQAIELVNILVFNTFRLYLFYLAITSPNYPNTFNLTRLDCKWSFKALHGAKIKVQLVDSDLNDGCNDNILNVVDDTPTAGRSRFKHPGKSAKCGMNDFKSVATAYEASGDIVTVTFKSLKNTGHATFKLLVTSFVARKRKVCPESTPDWSGCPAGPCCAGSDCCVFKPGKTAQGELDNGFCHKYFLINFSFLKCSIFRNRNS